MHLFKKKKEGGGVSHVKTSSPSFLCILLFLCFIPFVSITTRFVNFLKSFSVCPVCSSLHIHVPVTKHCMHPYCAYRQDSKPFPRQWQRVKRFIRRLLEYKIRKKKNSLTTVDIWYCERCIAYSIMQPAVFPLQQQWLFVSMKALDGEGQRKWLSDQTLHT